MAAIYTGTYAFYIMIVPYLHVNMCSLNKVFIVVASDSR